MHVVKNQHTNLLLAGVFDSKLAAVSVATCTLVQDGTLHEFLEICMLQKTHRTVLPQLSRCSRVHVVGYLVWLVEELPFKLRD